MATFINPGVQLAHFWQHFGRGLRTAACLTERLSQRQDVRVNTDSLQRADRIVWSIAAIALAVVVMAAVAGSFRIHWIAFGGFVVFSASLGGIGLFCRRVDAGERLASGLICMGQAVLFASMAAPLTYVAASVALPLWDAELMRWDQHLGYDWLAWVAATNDHLIAQAILNQAYASIGPQWIITVTGLAITGCLLRLRVFLAAIMLTILVATLLSAIFPAVGPATFYNGTTLHDVTSPAWLTSPAVVHSLREGTLRDLFGPAAEGIVTFPSVHAAAGLLFILAWWQVRYLRWVSLLANIAMIASTPVLGGHYLIDVFAGLILAVVCWKTASAMVDMRAAVPQILDAETPSLVPGMVTSPFTSRAIEQAQQNARSGVI